MTTAKPGMAAFRFIWLGQLVSIFGSAMTVFALSIWAFQQTGQATSVALIMFFAWLPGLLVGPLAGALVDRLPRKLVLMASDVSGGLASLVLLLLYASGNLQLWHIYLIVGLDSLFETFQWPALSAAITLMVDKENYSRASGLMSLANSASSILAPIAAAAILAVWRLDPVLLADVVSFCVSLLTLALVRIPEPERRQPPAEEKAPSLLADAWYGFAYILKRPGLLGIQFILFSYNFVKSFGFAVLVAMILARTAGDTVVLGTVQSAAGIGAVVAGLTLSLWPGGKRQIHGILLGTILSSLFAQTLFGLGRGVFTWAAFALLGTLFRPWIIAANQAIWQRKVAPEVQGRVFSARKLIGTLSIPLGYLLAGPLADHVFEPAMMPGGSLAETFGPLVGTGPGAGMALMFVFSGVITMLIGASGYAFKEVREVESLIPDHEPEVATEAATA